MIDTAVRKRHGARSLRERLAALETDPSVTDAAVSRIAQGTKILAECGYEKVFKQTFDCLVGMKRSSSKHLIAFLMSIFARPILATCLHRWFCDGCYVSFYAQACVL
ncbi:hypothetical protein Rs2_48948 [Raphanus sativus]|nr:hypothetical protein Rs2_48948 [Raphanus sativus]